MNSTSHHFRKLRKNFDVSCEKREEQANYSIFNINKTIAHVRSRR